MQDEIKVLWVKWQSVGVMTARGSHKCASMEEVDEFVAKMKGKMPDRIFTYQVEEGQ